MDFAGEGGVGGETSSEPPSQLVERAIQLGALSLELGGEGGSLGNGELRVSTCDVCIIIALFGPLRHGGVTR